MESLSKSVKKISAEVAVGPAAFTFVPVVRKLPIKSLLKKEQRSDTPTGNPDTNVAASHERTRREDMSEGELFKAEIVVIKDFVEAEEANSTQLEAKPQQRSSADYKSLSQTKDPGLNSARSGNTPSHTAMGTVSMETAVDKLRGISQQQCHDISGHSGDSLGCFANRALVPEDRTSPFVSPDLFPTPTSSRESILSQDLDKEMSLSAMQLSSVTSPASFSRTVSQCSSVLSGVFSPTVVPIKKHFLAPGSSLVNISQTCFSSCDSLSSACPQTPPPRRRPALTRLSLLTAILRKGRLPVLSSTLQRPYTPCWPVNPVTLSFCNACSAASSVASTPFELSSQFSSSASIDSQSHKCREPNRSITASPMMKSSIQNRKDPQTQKTGCREQIYSSGDLRQQHVTSPPPVKSNTLPETPQLSNGKSLSSLKYEKKASSSAPDSSSSKFNELRQRNTHVLLNVVNNHKHLVSPPSKFINHPETSVSQKQTRQRNSSLSKLQMLSQQLRSPPVSPPHLQTSRSHIAPSSVRTEEQMKAHPLLPLKQKDGGEKSEGSRPVSRSATPQAFQKAQCLSPSRHTPTVLSGWLSPITSPTPTTSPAPPDRDFTRSPSWSLRSTPSSRPGSGMTDCSDREDKKRKINKIKLSYKSLAAIPTNTLLLDQQAIDEQVEKEQNHFNTLDNSVLDTHTEMCSPAQLRQKSEELYAVIDEILANSSPETTSKPSNTNVFQHHLSSSKSLGRETKYASLCSLHPSASKEKNMMEPTKTKPGVIRPMTAIPRLRLEDEDEFQSNHHGQFVKQNLTDKKKGEISRLVEAQADLLGSGGKVMKKKMTPERTGLFSVCELHIKEPDEQIGPPGKEASPSFSTSAKEMEAFEACI